MTRALIDKSEAVTRAEEGRTQGRYNIKVATNGREKQMQRNARRGRGIDRRLPRALTCHGVAREAGSRHVPGAATAAEAPGTAPPGWGPARRERCPRHWRETTRQELRSNDGRRLS